MRVPVEISICSRGEEKEETDERVSVVSKIEISPFSGLLDGEDTNRASAMAVLNTRMTCRITLACNGF